MLQQQKGIIVSLSDQEVQKAREFARSKAVAKLTERDHQIDNRSEVKRSFTGMTGEMAVEKLLGRSFVDWTVGHSGNYDHPDLDPIGVKLGVKTVTKGLHHAINIDNTYDQILVVKINDNTYEVCGLASAEVLNKYQDASLIKDKRMIERKTGFVGYEHLIPAEFINEYIDCIYG